jgi:hypothetical protein
MGAGSRKGAEKRGRYVGGSNCFERLNLSISLNQERILIRIEVLLHCLIGIPRLLKCANLKVTIPDYVLDP